MLCWDEMGKLNDSTFFQAAHLYHPPVWMVYVPVAGVYLCLLLPTAVLLLVFSHPFSNINVFYIAGSSSQRTAATVASVTGVPSQLHLKELATGWNIGQWITDDFLLIPFGFR